MYPYYPYKYPFAIASIQRKNLLNFTANNPTNCEWTEWQSTTCSLTCGGGTRTKTRTKKVTEAFGGTCEGETILTEECNTQGCYGKELAVLL